MAKENPKKDEALEGEEEFDIRKAFNTAGFAEFMAQHGDKDTSVMEDTETLEKRFEVFTIKEKVIKGIKEVVSNHIQKEVDVKLGSKDMSSIDEYLNKQAVENPDKIIEMEEKLLLYKELPKEIELLEEQMAEIGDSDELTERLGQLRKNRNNLETARETMGFFGKTKFAIEMMQASVIGIPSTVEAMFGLKMSDEYHNRAGVLNRSIFDKVSSQEAVKDKYGEVGKSKANSIMSSINDDIKDIENQLASIDKVEEIKTLAEEMFRNKKSELLGKVLGIAELTTIIQSKVESQMTKLIETGTIPNLDIAQERYESLKEKQLNGEIGMDPTEKLDKKDFQEKVDIAIEKAVSEEIKQTVNRANLGDNALTKLEKALDPFLSREKIGSKVGDEAREVIENSLEKAAKALGFSIEGKAKKLLIAQILIQMAEK